MISKYLSKTKKAFKFLLMFGVLGFFAYCTTSTGKVASSFSKRKYTKGHFSNPVAKVKTDYNTYSTDNSIATANNQVVEPDVDNSKLTKTGSTELKPNFSASVKSNSNVTQNNQPKAGNTGIFSNATVTNNNNASIKESSGNDPDHGYRHDDRGSHNSNASTYLLIWVISLIVCIICFLLFAGEAASISAGSSAAAGSGCILLLLSSVASILAIVFFILWIVAISN